MVFSCVSTSVSLHHHDTWETCAITCYWAECCRKYKIALRGCRKAPAVVNTCEDNTNHFVRSACAVRRKLLFLFFASLEASPFHPRAIASTHTLNQTGRVWVGKGSWDQEASRAGCQEGWALCWGCRYDIQVCQDSKVSVHRKSKWK